MSLTTTAISEIAARTFRVDAKGVEVRRRLAGARVRSIVLKGPGFARLLYAQARSRPYVDVDLLVDPGQLAQAEAVLRADGFRPTESEALSRQVNADVGRSVGVQGGSHATTWLRDRDRFTIDLHDSLPQCVADPRAVWRALTEHVQVLSVAGEPTETLDATASALLVALHAAHHGPGSPQAKADLEAALDVFDTDRWRAARDLAMTLEAETAMGVGLGTTQAGRAVALDLGLASEPTTLNWLAWSGAPWSASVLAAMAEQRSARTAALAAFRIVCPTPSALRRGSALARRGRGCLVAAYVVRPLLVAQRLPAAVRAWRRAATRQWA